MEYTPLTGKEVDRICRDYPLDRVTAFEVLSGGSENTNYLLTTGTGKYVLSICEQKSMEEATQLVQLLQYLEDHQFYTSRVIRTRTNAPISEWQEKPVMIKSYIGGTVERDMSPRLIRLVGRQLGKLHRIAAPEYLPGQLNFGREKFSLVKTYAEGSPFDHWLQEVEAYIAPFLNLDLPRSLVHADVFWNNVIIRKDRQSVVIMDFEEAAWYYRVFDIGMTIIGICSRADTIDLEKTADLLQGYQEEIEMTAAEEEALKPFTVYAGAAMTFWRHMNFNYVNPTPGMSDHYLGLKEVTDYVKDVEDKVFLNMMDSKR